MVFLQSVDLRVTSTWNRCLDVVSISKAFMQAYNFRVSSFLFMSSNDICWYLIFSWFQEPSACSSGCICDQPTNWKTEEISLNHLHELEIEGFRASEHEVAFVKRLLNWVPMLKMMTVTLDCSITKSKANELFQGFSRPGVCMQFYSYQRFRKVLFTPED